VMAMKITRRDKYIMCNDVASIIDDWSTNITINRLKPAKQQPGFNPLLGEVVGTPGYDTIISRLPVETYYMQPDSVKPSIGGDRYEGRVNIHIPVDRYDMLRSNDGIVVSLRMWLPRYVCRKLSRDINMPIILDEECIFTFEGVDNSSWRLRQIKCMPATVIVSAVKMVGDPYGG